MAQNVVFAVGTEFHSFSEFQNRLKLYEKQENTTFYVASSKPLKVNPEIDAKIKYKRAQYACKFAGESRSKVAAENRKRQTKTFRQGCSSRFSISSKLRNGEYILRINSLIEEHDHPRSEKLFKVLPKQRRATLEKVQPYLEKVFPVKPNMMLVQNQICTNDADGGIVKRRDLYNLRSKMKESLIGNNDLEKMVNEMKTVKGELVFHLCAITLNFFG